MMGHNISFEGDIWKIIPKLSLLPLLAWSTAESNENWYAVVGIKVLDAVNKGLELYSIGKLLY